MVDTRNADDPAAAVDRAVYRARRDQDRRRRRRTPAHQRRPAGPAALEQQLDGGPVRHHHRRSPTSGPSDAATKDLVDDHPRPRLTDLPGETGARALVTGLTAVGVDISQALADVFPLYLLIVVGLAILLLVLVFRSILVPLKAALGFVLSLGISLGVTVAVFQWGWLNDLLGVDTTGPVIFILPLLLIGVLFGLAMDYEVFLVTRMREAYVHGTPARQAVVVGFQHSARVVTAAAVIMIGVFAGFVLGERRRSSRRSASPSPSPCSSTRSSSG